MAEKVIWNTALTDIATSADDVLGAVRSEPNAKMYRFVKNYGTTLILAGAPCLQVITSVEAAANCKVNSVDTSATVTASQFWPAGIAVTGIYASGSATGDHGWVQIAGLASAMVALTGAAYIPGYKGLPVATAGVSASVSTTLQCIGHFPAPGTTDTPTTGQYARFFSMAQNVASCSTAQYCVNALVNIHCI